MAASPNEIDFWRPQLACAFPSVQDVFPDCLTEAQQVLSPTGLQAYVDCARTLGKMGRGPEPVLAFLQEWPQVAAIVGESMLADVNTLLHSMQKSPNSAAIAPLLNTLAAVARRLHGEEPMRYYLRIVQDVMVSTSVSIHGHHTTFSSPGLPVLLEQAPHLLGMLTVAGLGRWAAYGTRHYQHHPDRQREYFSLALSDSRAVLLRERHGTLLADVEQQLALTLRALWDMEAPLRAYATGQHDKPTPAPWTTHRTQEDSICLPDVYDDCAGVSGLDRYRLTLAHMAAHRRWSQALVADNLSPLQRLAIECLEDARVDHLLLLRYPGLRPLLLALHPRPTEGACDPAVASCLRHRLVMLSRALIDPGHGYQDPALLECVHHFHSQLGRGESNTVAMQTLALRYAARTRCQSDQLARMYFHETVVGYRDDNRHLWTYIERGDEEECFEETPRTSAAQPHGLPPRHYPEWDHCTQSYRPDWVSVYEAAHPGGNAGAIDNLLEQYRGLALQLSQQLELLKPQNRERIRYQEEGSELDLDVALRSLVDWRAGAQPDPRILMHHRTSERNIAVLVLMDLSESLNDAVEGTDQSRLALSQTAVALLSWAIDRLGDRFALAGFHSNTRHDVRYHHIKGFSEQWAAAAKGRLAEIEARYSTRMGAALRHAAHYLQAQPCEKKLLIVLTDGRPCDVDVPDAQALVDDTRLAVRELVPKGIHTHCVSLDPQADAYVHDIFSHHFTVIDRIEQLPRNLTQLFFNLTH